MKRPLTLAASLMAALPAFSQGVVWHQDLDSALQAAKASHRQVFLSLWTEWSPPCLKMRDSVFPVPQAQAALKKVVPAAVMVERKDHTAVPESADVDKKYGSGAYPTLLILDADGKVLRRHTGSLDAAGLAKFITGE